MSCLQTARKCPSKKSAKRPVADEFGAEEFDKSHDLYSKKQKQLSQGLPEMTNAGDFSGGLQVVDYDSTSLCNFVCAFCQTWKETEVSFYFSTIHNCINYYFHFAGTILWPLWLWLGLWKHNFSPIFLFL